MGVSAETVVGIVSREFPGAGIGDVRDVSGGRKSTHVVGIDGREVVVSACGPGCDEPGFAAEPAVMDRVAGTTPIPVPEVIAADLSGAGFPPYYVAERVEGYDPAARYKYLPRGRRERLLARAGEYLAELHRGVRFDDVGRLRAADGSLAVEPSGSWPAFLDSLAGEWIDGLAGGRFGDLAATFEAALDRAGDVVPSDVRPSLLHFDYRPANLIVRGDRIAAVLDWGMAVSGHAEYDLFKAEKNFLLAHFETPSVRDDLREHLLGGYRRRSDLAPGWRSRRAVYRIAYKLESMRSFERWTAGLDPDERAATERTLRAELADDLDRLGFDPPGAR